MTIDGELISYLKKTVEVPTVTIPKEIKHLLYIADGPTQKDSFKLYDIIYMLENEKLLKSCIERRNEIDI